MPWVKVTDLREYYHPSLPVRDAQGDRLPEVLADTVFEWREAPDAGRREWGVHRISPAWPRACVQVCMSAEPKADKMPGTGTVDACIAMHFFEVRFDYQESPDSEWERRNLLPVELAAEIPSLLTRAGAEMRFRCERGLVQRMRIEAGLDPEGRPS